MNATAPLLFCSFVPCLAFAQLGNWLLWAGSLGLFVTIGGLLWSRWGHSSPIHKCAALSLLVHLMLGFLTMTVRIVSGDGEGAGGGGGGPPIHVRIVEEAARPAAISIAAQTEHTADFAPPPLLTSPPPKKEEPTPVVKTEPPAPKPEAPPIVADKTTKEAAKEKEIVVAPGAKPPVTSEAKAAPIEPPSTPKKPAEAPTPPVAESRTKLPIAAPSTAAATPAQTTPIAAPAADTASVEIAATNAYALRSTPGRLGLVAGQGGNAQTEAAVAAALRWLAAAQSKDGRWDAMLFGAGQEEMVLGRNRGGAGRGADTGVTALALLAFMGAGHSHMQGVYQDNVHRGLDFLLRSQAADGSLFGDATLYAQMYCHSMATFALAEAQAVTGDRRLDEPVTRAVGFSLAAQNTSTGGWRYRPGDTGDTSQLGWQIMAITSAKRAGFQIPDQTWQRVDHFLQTVRRGNSGGLASYRPDSPVSTSMTAEALYCRLMLQEVSTARLPEAEAQEATAQLLASPPSTERLNLYYWYYATLALHHRQHASEAATSAWRVWNDAMTNTLTKSQVTDGDNAGSWDTNTVWGGYGGRVYTTSMAAMCLEVYYRYAPAPGIGSMWAAKRPLTQSTTK